MTQYNQNVHKSVTMGLKTSSQQTRLQLQCSWTECQRKPCLNMCWIQEVLRSHSLKSLYRTLPTKYLDTPTHSHILNTKCNICKFVTLTSLVRSTKSSIQSDDNAGITRIIRFSRKLWECSSLVYQKVRNSCKCYITY